MKLDKNDPPVVRTKVHMKHPTLYDVVGYVNLNWVAQDGIPIHARGLPSLPKINSPRHHKLPAILENVS
jgi:hypothetical protein